MWERVRLRREPLERESSEANVVHFLAKGSEEKRAVVIAGAGSGSAFRGEDQRLSSLRATDLFRRMVRRISGRTMIDD